LLLPVHLAVLTAVVLLVLFSRGISGRIARLVEDARRLERHEPLGPPIGGRDEVAHLDQVFREMAAAVSEAARRDRELAALLKRRVAERTAELTEANHVLTQKSQENEMFVYSVSHDLRSPLINL
jgi:signal transduction histidine kinase